jgi:putative ABC transport system permease protein
MRWFSAVRARLNRILARESPASRVDEEKPRRRRALAWLDGLSLDFRLGLRMLVKYPGLTIVGGVAMAFAIWLGSIIFELVMPLVHPTLPLPDGDRIVQLRNWDAAAGGVDPRALHDFVAWREALRSVTDIGAYRDLYTNLAARDDDARPVAVAEITASAFRVAPAVPLLGRVLVPADERAGAPAVIVIGYDVWRTRFAGERAVIGRSVRLGDGYATVVGVMPEGYAFPVAHEAWTPLRSDILEQPPRDGPAVTVFGRLAPGVSLRAAQVELSVLGARAARQFPATHEHLRPQVVEYTRSFWDPSPTSLAIAFSINLFGVMLLVLVCGNVALLMFARAAARESELVVRSALGASRGRIVAQLFAEALVLGAVAATVGLTATHLVLKRWGMTYMRENVGTLPFWYDVRLSPATVVYAAGLTLLGAAIAGVLPALKVTHGLGTRLRQGTAGGGLRFGGVWTAVIVTQVAFTVAFPAVAFVEQRELLRIRSYPAGFAAEEYLSARLEMGAASDGGTGAQPAESGEAAEAARRARFAAALERVRQGVAAEPGVRGVTFVDRLPREGHVERYIELDDPSPAAGKHAAAPPSAVPPLREVSTARIDPSYFKVLETPILAGRGFHAGDLAPGARAVIVDRGFVDQVLLGRNAIGRRVRFAREQRGDTLADDARPWYEIVGVVNELGMGAATQQGRPAGMYLPAAPGSAGPLNLVVHVRGDPASLSPRLRAIATAADPALQLTQLQRVDQVTSAALWILGLWLKITLLLTGIALLLSLTGIYSVLSFTVARRTREIGVRVALGATRWRVVTAVFRRPLTQVGLGVVAGGTLIGVAAILMSGHKPDEALQLEKLGAGITPGQVAVLLGYVAFMFAVCLLACVVPTRRALSVEPMEALRVE